MGPFKMKQFRGQTVDKTVAKTGKADGVKTQPHPLAMHAEDNK